MAGGVIMAHRGLGGSSRNPWARLGWELLGVAVLCLLFSVVFIAGDMLAYGHVRW
jgi:hypothetical protein